MSGVREMNKAVDPQYPALIFAIDSSGGLGDACVLGESKKWVTAR